MAYPGYPPPRSYDGYPGYATDPRVGYSHKERKYGPERIGYDNQSYDRREYERPQVISSQPRSMRQTGGGMRDWNTGLFDCTSDMKVCFCVWCCSPFYECYIIDRDFGESCWNVVCCGSGVFVPLRYRFRDRYNIVGSLMNDLAVGVCCTSCLICQLIRENNLAIKNGANVIGDSVK